MTSELQSEPAEEAESPEIDAASKNSEVENSEGEEKKEEVPQVDVPGQVVINEFQQKSLNDLHAIAQELRLRVAGIRSKRQLVFEILQFYGKHGTAITATGFLDCSRDNAGFLRWPAFSFLANGDDVYVPTGVIKKHGLKPGQKIACSVRSPRDREKFLSVDEVTAIEDVQVGDWESKPGFDQLTALFPSERIILEQTDSDNPSTRVLDLIAPLGKGQRGLIVAPPRGGKTILLKSIAVSVQKNHPEVDLIVLLLDERPEEVTDFHETVDAAVYSSTFDESPKRHIEVADMVLERAKRSVECGRDVVILLDSLTRLARAHNSSNQSGGGDGGGKGGRRGGRGGGRGGGGPVGSGGISPKALERSRRFFGAARNVEEGGSLTILATCLIETDSRMDDVIFEEFKGTGNMEITLDREMAESRIFPAIHTLKSGTRKDDLLYHPDELQRVTNIRKQMAKRPAAEAMEILLKMIRSTNSNAELLLRGFE